MPNREEMFRELEEFTNGLGQPSFCCVYGSCASNLFRPGHSDLDLFFAMDLPSKSKYAECHRFLVQLHSSYNLELDDEVPLHNKLLVSYQDLNHAVEIHSNTKRIDPIVKSEEFLGSPEMRLRLLFNALTTPNYCVGGMCNDYLFYKERAELGLVTLSDKISGKDTPTTTRVDDLIRSDDGKEGEDYLGYKNLRPVRSYLQYILHKNTTNPGD